MKIVYSASELDLELQRLLDEHGCTLVSSRPLAIEAKAYREESQTYDNVVRKLKETMSAEGILMPPPQLLVNRLDDG